MTHPILQQLTDAVHYDRFRSPFSGDGGQFACLYATDGPVGIGPVHARASQATRLITEATLQLWVRFGGRWQAVHRQTMRSRPAAAEESAAWRAAGATLAVTARTVFADPRTAWHEQVVTNVGEEPITLDLAASGRSRPDREINDRLGQRFGEPYEKRRAFVDAA